MKIKDDKFWAKVQRYQDPYACWVWLGARDNQGYGKITRKEISSQPIRANRYAFYLHHGRWPEGACHHSCGNKACVRPSHLIDDLLRPVPGKNELEMYYIGGDVQRRYAKSSRINGVSALAREYEVSPAYIRTILSWETEKWAAFLSDEWKSCVKTVKPINKL